MLTGELLVDLLEAHDISAIPFKGPTLALWAYGDITRREFGDLDILVRKRDVPAVMELLSDEGLTPRPQLTGAQQAAILRFDCSHNSVNDKDLWVDVHWDFVSPTASVRFETDNLWNRLASVSLNQRKLKTVSIEDLLLILCLHGFTHFWERLGWISDVAALIESHKEIDWLALLENADRTGNRRILLLGLYLARNLLAAPVPPDFWTKAPVDEMSRCSPKKCSAAYLKRPAHSVSVTRFAFIWP